MLQPTSKQGDAEFKRGLRILEQDALSVGETLEDWAKHISAGCGWSDERSPLRAELTRLSKIWSDRGYILMPKDGRPRITPSHCRDVKSAWRRLFGSVIGVDPESGWLDRVPAFKDLVNKADAQHEAHQRAMGKSAMARWTANYSFLDAVRLAEECLHETGATALDKEPRYKFMLAHVTVAFGLLGARTQLLLVPQRYSMTSFADSFGAGDAYTNALFNWPAYKHQPPMLNLEHRPKGGTSHTPMPLIPARIFALCPTVSLGLLRIIQFGRHFDNASPPAEMAPGTASDWPFLATKLNDPSTPPRALDTSALAKVAESLGLSTEGGLHLQLRNLNTLEASADPDCSRDTGERMAEHNREGVRETTYKTFDAELALRRAHYKGKDPQAAASLCAFIELLTEHNSELTRQALLLLSDAFGVGYKKYLAAEVETKHITHKFYSTTLYAVKAVIVLSRCRLYDYDFMINEKSPTPLDVYLLLQNMLAPLKNDPFTPMITQCIERYERSEISLGEMKLFGATSLKQMDCQQRAVDDLLAARLGELRGINSTDLDKLERQRDTGELTELEFRRRIGRVKPSRRGGGTERRLLMLSTAESEHERVDASLEPDERIERLFGYPTEADAMAEGRRDWALMDELRAEDAASKAAAAARRKFHVGQKRPCTEIVAPAMPPEMRRPPPQLPAPPQPSQPPQRGASQLSAFQIKVNNTFANLNLTGSPARIVSFFVHHWLPLEFSGLKPRPSTEGGPSATDKIGRQRKVLYQALSLTVDESGEPRPDRLRHVLHECAVPGSVERWAMILDGAVRERMERFVFGGGTSRAPILTVAKQALEALQAGIGADGTTEPEPSNEPEPEPLPPPPTERFFISLDPGCSPSKFGVSRITADGTTIVKIEHMSFHPSGRSDTSARGQGRRMASVQDMLSPLIAGAAGVFMEDYKVDKGKLQGVETNFYMRSIPLMLAYQADVSDVEVVVQSSWQSTFRKPTRMSLSGKIDTAEFVYDTTEASVCSHAIDAICIGLHSLLERGYTLAVRELVPLWS